MTHNYLAIINDFVLMGSRNAYNEVMDDLNLLIYSDGGNDIVRQYGKYIEGVRQ